MKPDVQKKLAYIAVIYISAVYASLAIRSILLGRNDRMKIFYALLIIMAVSVILALRYGYTTPGAEIFRRKVIILKILHFQFVFSLLFIGLEAVTVFSIELAVVTLLFIAAIRYYIIGSRHGILVMGTLIEAAALIFAVIVMPEHSTGEIVAFQMAGSMGSYINGFLCALILSLMEIPFNPIWSFEKNLKG